MDAAWFNGPPDDDDPYGEHQDDEDRGSSLGPDRWPEPEDWDAAREAAEDEIDRRAEDW